MNSSVRMILARFSHNIGPYFNIWIFGRCLKLIIFYKFRSLSYTFVVYIYSNRMSFFRFASKGVVYLDDKISLVHARCTHLIQVIKSQNKIIYSVVNVLNIYIHWKLSTFPKLINMRCAIKTCKHNIIATYAPSIRLTFLS